MTNGKRGEKYMTYLDFDDIARKIKEKKMQGEIQKQQGGLEGAKGDLRDVKGKVEQAVANVNMQIKEEQMPKVV